MDKFYRFFADTFPQLFGFVGKAIPALADAAQLVKTIVLIACLALAAFAVAAMVIGCFKIRFFRRLARTLLVIETLGMVGLVLIALNTVKGGDFVADLVKALEIGSPAVFDLIKGIFSDFGVKIVPSFIIILVAFTVISLLLHLIIAELSRNNGGAQFISCFDRELFSGKFKKIRTLYRKIGVFVLYSVFDKYHRLASEISADYGLSHSYPKMVEARGHVSVENQQNGQSMYSEKLYWYQDTKMIYTRSKVRIVMPDKDITGDSLVTTEGFEEYTIYNGQATFEVEDE